MDLESPILKALAPWNKSYDKPRQCIRKQRLHFANKGPCGQSYSFPSTHVWMAVSAASSRGLSAEESVLSNWRWRRLLRVPWMARSNHSTLYVINSEYSLEGLALQPKLQFFFHLMQRANSLEKTLMLGKMEGGRRMGRPRMRW